MITAYTLAAGKLVTLDDIALDDPGSGALGRATWIDLNAPTAAEERAVETALALSVPTRADMEEIEASSRLYLEDGAAFMTALLPSRTGESEPFVAPVTFVLATGCLVTVRYHDAKAFAVFTARATRADTGLTDAQGLLVGLLETIVDRIADSLERAGADLDALGRDVFRAAGAGASKSPDFNAVLRSIGRKGDLNSKLRDSLSTLERLAGFLANALPPSRPTKETRDRIKTLSRDVRSLGDHATFQSQKITFLLDATLGLINIEQNGIIKIFSVAAVIFLPPTLIASIYGMNFALMPELDWPFGYPLAIGLMLASAGGTFLYFKRRGWL